MHCLSNKLPLPFQFHILSTLATLSECDIDTEVTSTSGILLCTAATEANKQFDHLNYFCAVHQVALEIAYCSTCLF